MSLKGEIITPVLLRQKMGPLLYRDELKKGGLGAQKWGRGQKEKKTLFGLGSLVLCSFHHGPISFDMFWGILVHCFMVL